ncbi:MAG: hypothetical protein WCP29_05270 [Acidobacteriota bacterium]
MPSHDMPVIMREILKGYTLPQWGDHGVLHWARVMENGLRVADTIGADREVVTLFALFHDSRRRNEYRDNGHGLRGAEFAQSLRGTLVHLDDERFDLLFRACRLHTDGLIEGDPTMLACWDADRLDLARVGITPRPHRLCTDAARELVTWASQRAEKGHEPTGVLASWGLDPNAPERRHSSHQSNRDRD